MKKSIIFCISILALVFASCKSTPTAEETTDETAQETTVQPVVEDQAALVETNDNSAGVSEAPAAEQIASLNQAKLGKLEKARQRAIDANAPELLPEPFQEAEKVYNDRKDYVSEHFETESFADEIEALTVRYEAIAEAAEAAGKKKLIEELDLAQYDKAGYQKGETAWNKLVQQYEADSSADDLLSSAKDVNAAYAKVLTTGLKSIAAKARTAALAAKKKADSVYAGVSQKSVYRNCSDKIAKADSALVTGNLEGAYKGYRDAEASFLALYENVNKKRAAAQNKIDEAKKAVENAENYAVEADEKAPLTEVVDGIEEEDATLLEEEVYQNPEDSVIDVNSTEIGKSAAEIEASEE